MKEITSFATMSEDIINNTVELVTQQIKSKNIDFSELKNPTDILRYFNEATSNMKYPTDKFDSNTGERVMKRVADLYGRKLNTDMLKAIYSNISNWYYTEYEDRFVVEPVYTKEIVDVIKELKKAAWMITGEDVPKFFNALINTAKVMNGVNKTTENQKSYWIVSPVKGGGKTTLTDAIFDGFEKDGYICKKLGMPEKEWPDLRPFANCHFAVVNDISKAPDYDVFKALTRRETFDSRIRCVGLVSTKPRAAIWGSSNYNAPFETDRGSVTINTVGLTVEGFGKTQLGQTILNNAKTADLSGISIFSHISNTLPSDFFKKNETKDASEIEKKYAKITKIKGIDALINLIEGYVMLDPENAKENLKKITLNKLRKDSYFTISETQFSLIDRVLESIREIDCGLVSRGKKNGEWRYTSWNLSELSDITTEILEGDEETITPEEEIKENQEVWDKIIAYFENNPTTDIPPKKEMTDDEAFAAFDKLCNEQMQLFNTIDEPVGTYKDCYQTLPTNNDDDEFETVNPIKAGEKRCDDNVASKRNFVFEMDDESLQGQMKYTEKLIKEKVINRCVFSGSKSLHNRITINFEPESKEEYKWIFKKLNEKYFDGKADKACSNLSRFTRKPNGYRKDKGKVQKLFFKAPFVLDCAYLHQEYLDYKKAEQERYAMLAAMSKSNNENIDFPISEIPNKIKSPKAELVELCLNGTASYDEGVGAFQYLVYLGYEYDEMINAIDWGNWNFTESFYNTCKSK